MLGTLGWDGTQKILKIMTLQASNLSLSNRAFSLGLLLEVGKAAGNSTKSSISGLC